MRSFVRSNLSKGLLVLGVWSSIAMAQPDPPKKPGPAASPSASSAPGPSSAPSASAPGSVKRPAPRPGPSASASARPGPGGRLPASSASASASADVPAPASAPVPVGSGAPAASASATAGAPARTAPTAAPGPTYRPSANPTKVLDPYRPQRIYLEPGAFRFSLTGWLTRGPKSETEMGYWFPLALNGGFQISRDTYVGLDDFTYQRIDVPRGKRHSLSMAPTLEKQFLFRKGNISHHFVHIGLVGQQRWGAGIDARSGYAYMVGYGYRAGRCYYDRPRCWLWSVEARGYGAATDFMMSPMLMPKGSFLGTLGVGVHVY